MSDPRSAARRAAVILTAGGRAAQRVGAQGGLNPRRFRATVVSVDDVAGTAVLDVVERGGTVMAWRQGPALGAGNLDVGAEVYVDAMGDGVWVTSG